MSIWSSLGKFIGAAGSVAGPIVSIANPLLGAGLTAGSATLGKLSTDYENKKAVENANSTNLSENQKNRDFNALEAAKNRQFQSAETEKQNAFNAAQSQLAFDRSAKFQQQMWQKENEYNTPLAQVKRLEQAGINPNLFGGDNTAGSAGSAVSPAASGSAPSGSVASAGGSLSASPYSIVNPSLELAQIRLAQAQASNLEAKTKTEDATRDGIVKLNDKQYQLWDSEIPVNEANAKFLDSSARKQDAEINLINENIKKAIAETSLIDKQGQIVQKEVDAFEKKLISSLAEANSRMQLNLANVKGVASQIALNAANAQKAIAEGQSYALQNYLDGVKMQFFDSKGKEYLYEITENNVVAEWLGSANARSAGKREKYAVAADEKMYRQMNDNIVAALRAIGSAFNLSFGAHASVRP